MLWALVAAGNLWVGAALASFPLRSGILVSRTEALIFKMGEGHSVDAIELSSGAVRWSSRDAQKPLALLPGNRLLAQIDAAEGPGRLRLALLDLTEAGQAVAGLDFRLPSRVHASVVDLPTGRFAAEAEVVRDLVLVHWTYTIGHTAFGGGVERSSARQLSGTVAFDLISGAAREAREVQEAAATASGSPLDAPLPAKLIRELADAHDLNVYRPSPEIVAATDISQGKLRLRRWRASDGEELSRALVTDQVPVAHTVSADARHLQVATLTQRKPRSPHEQHRPYEWSVLALETGDQVMQRTAERSETEFFVIGRTLVDVAPPDRVIESGKQVERGLRLRAFDTATGAQKWTRALRGLSPTARAPAGHVVVDQGVSSRGESSREVADPEVLGTAGSDLPPDSGR